MLGQKEEEIFGIPRAPLLLPPNHRQRRSETIYFMGVPLVIKVKSAYKRDRQWESMDAQTTFYHMNLQIFDVFTYKI